MNRKERILNLLSDSLLDIFVYDLLNNDDDELKQNDVKEAILSGEITESDMIEKFTKEVNNFFREIRTT